MAKPKQNIRLVRPVIVLVLVFLTIATFWYVFTNGLLTPSKASRPTCVKKTDAQGKCYQECKIASGKTVKVPCQAVGTREKEQKEKKTGCKRVAVDCNNEDRSGTCYETVCDGE